MSNDLARRESPYAAALLERRGELATVRSELTEREAALADLRRELKAFEGLYLRQAGVLYAELDEWEARIAEQEVSLYGSDEARQRAAAARERAAETHAAAFGDAEAAQPVEPTAALRALFREAAKRVHPDFARDDAEAQHFTRLMARANKAYRRGDAEALQRILDDFQEASVGLDEADDAAELLRLERQIQHAQRDLAAIDEQIATLPQNEIAQFKVEAEAAAVDGRDLLAELAASLRERISNAEYRFRFVEKQLQSFR